MTSGTLFNMNTVEGLQSVPNVPPHNGTETSRAAADRQTPMKVEGDRLTINSAFMDRGPDGYTREELADATGMNPNTINPRCNELVAMGVLCKKLDADGNKVKRRTRSGSPAQVLVHTRHATNEEHCRP